MTHEHAPGAESDVDLTPTTEVLTFEEARARLRVGRSTMFRLIHEGSLPSIKIGRSLRFTGEDLEKFLHERRRENQPA